MGNKPTSSSKDVSVSGHSTTKHHQSTLRPTTGGIKESASYSNDDSADGFGGVVKAQPLSLSPYQKNLLREAWQRIGKKGASSIGSQIFRRMFESNSDIKKVFQHVAVIEGVFSAGLTSPQAYQHHSELFIELLDDSILNIDDLNSLIPKLNEYGAKHAPFKAYGFKAEYWDIFGEAMIAAAREWEGWRKHRETLRAWTLLISFLVDRMRQGYESTVRRPGMIHQYSTAQNHSHDDEDPQADNDAEVGPTPKEAETSNNDEDQINCAIDEGEREGTIPNENTISTFEMCSARDDNKFRQQYNSV